jgi:subtilisin family serine protease
MKYPLLVFFLFSFTLVFSQEYYLKFSNSKDYNSFIRANYNKVSWKNEPYLGLQISKSNTDWKKKDLILFQEEIPKTILALDTTFSDPFYPNQWEHKKTGMTFAWNFLQEDDPNFLVAIIDGGNNYYNEDLQNYFINTADSTLDDIDDDGNGYVDDYRGWDFGDDDNDPSLETTIHGFEMNSIVASIPNNGKGLVSPGLQMKYIHLKIVDETNIVLNPYSAVKYAIDIGAKVVSCSWYQEVNTSLAQEMADYAEKNNVLLVAAGGNNNNNKKVYPAGLDNVLSVGGIKPDLSKSGASNYQQAIDVYAPAYYLTSTTDTNSYALVSSGTSPATAFTSSAAVLIRKIFPEENAKEIRNRIIKGAKANPLNQDPNAKLLYLPTIIGYNAFDGLADFGFYSQLNGGSFIINPSLINSESSISIYSVEGKLIHTIKVQDSEIVQLDYPFETGVYFAQLTHKNGFKDLKFILVN